MNKLSFSKVVCLVFVFCAATATASHVQTFKTLINFDGTNGGQPAYVTLVQGFDGGFYGTTLGGGYYGNIFKITVEGTLTTLQDLGGSEGALPYAGLVQGTDGNFYGTAHSGGGGGGSCHTGCGTVFKITPGGTMTVLHRFSGDDGSGPAAVLVQATNGDFYGTTSSTVFKMTPRGTLTTLYYFDTEGDLPMGGLLQATNGDFYGTTRIGGFFLRPKQLLREPVLLTCDGCLLVRHERVW